MINNESKGITNGIAKCGRTACVQGVVEISVGMCSVHIGWRHWNEN